MNIDMSPSQNSLNFGLKPSDEVIHALSNATDRFFKVRRYSVNKLKKKYAKPIEAASKVDYFLQFNSRVCAKNKLLNKHKSIIGYFNTISEKFPFSSMYIAENKKNHQYYYALKSFLGEKLLMPVKTKNNANPLENPDLIHISFQDLKQLAKKINRMKFSEIISYIFKK